MGNGNGKENKSSSNVSKSSNISLPYLKSNVDSNALKFFAEYYEYYDKKKNFKMSTKENYKLKNKSSLKTLKDYENYKILDSIKKEIDKDKKSKEKKIKKSLKKENEKKNNFSQNVKLNYIFLILF